MGRLGLRAVIQVRRRLFRPELRVNSLIPDVLKGGSGRKVLRHAHWVLRVVQRISPGFLSLLLI